MDGRTKRRQHTRRQLLNAGAQLLDEQDEELSVASVIERAGVSHGSFYNHFASLDDFLEELVQSGSQVGTHWPSASHVVSAGHTPHVPSHPSSPHTRPVQSGSHVGTHWPSASHVVSSGHTPQMPPHPSSPHTRSPQ